MTTIPEYVKLLRTALDRNHIPTVHVPASYKGGMHLLYVYTSIFERFEVLVDSRGYGVCGLDGMYDTHTDNLVEAMTAIRRISKSEEDVQT